MVILAFQHYFVYVPAMFVELPLQGSELEPRPPSMNVPNGERVLNLKCLSQFPLARKEGNMRDPGTKSEKTSPLAGSYYKRFGTSVSSLGGKYV